MLPSGRNPSCHSTSCGASKKAVAKIRRLFDGVQNVSEGLAATIGYIVDGGSTRTALRKEKRRVEFGEFTSYQVIEVDDMAHGFRFR